MCVNPVPTAYLGVSRYRGGPLRGGQCEYYGFAMFDDEVKYEYCMLVRFDIDIVGGCTSSPEILLYIVYCVCRT